MNIRNFLVEQKCPICFENKADTVLKYDRYLLKINLSVCNSCGTLYTKNNFNESEIGTFYKDFYRYLYNDVNEVTNEFIEKSGDKKFAQFRYDRILSFCKLNNLNFDNVVEIGSGTGQFITLLNNDKKNFLGIEPGDTFFKFLSKKYFSSNVTNSFFEDADIPFNPDFFVSFHVLEHIINPNNFIKSIHSRLNDKGYLIIEVPCYDYNVDWEGYGVLDIHIAHVVYYTEDTISKLLTENGFKVIKIEKNLDNDLIKNNLRVFAIKDTAEIYQSKLSMNSEVERYKIAFNKFTFLSKNGYFMAIRSNIKAIIKLLF